MENVSCYVSDVLDCIGYSQEIINVRRNFWQHKTQLHNNEIKILKLVIAGSKAEGITSFYESDIDLMRLSNDVICTDGIQSLPPLPDTTILHADTRDAPPGYTRLKLIRCNGAFSRTEVMESAFKSELGDVYISSSLFASCHMHEMRRTSAFTCSDLSGPAALVTDGHLFIDEVFAISCFSSQFLQTWKTRRPLHNWPPRDVRETAASMLAQVVPVGSKGSDDGWREWRFCFIESELKLTFSLNETQMKLYILLKMVAKDILKNVSNAISSYIMKNVTFWMAELLPEGMFRKDNLLLLLFLSMRFLKSAITHWNWLPYYMIPERNLLAERLSYDDKRELSDLLETLIAEGPQFLLRCTKLRTGLKAGLSSPISLVDYRGRRHEVEILWYLHFFLTKYNTDESTTKLVTGKLFNSTLPEWKMFKLRGISPENNVWLFEEQLKSILS